MRWPTYVPELPVLSTLSGASLGYFNNLHGGATPVSTAWPTANKAIYFPLVVTAPFPVVRLWWLNGATAAGNVDCGIYTLGQAQLCHCGNTAQAGVNVPQSVAPIGGTYLLQPGPYMIGLSASLATATFFVLAQTTREIAEQGGAEQVTANPLPDPAVFATMVATVVPIMGISRTATI